MLTRAELRRLRNSESPIIVIYARLLLASEDYRGVRLSADDVMNLMSDAALEGALYAALYDEVDVEGESPREE